jgi:hypothetical protein
MSEIFLPALGYNVISVSVDATNVHGQDRAGKPLLYVPLKLQVAPTGEKGDVHYSLLRLAGKLQTPQATDFAVFELFPTAPVVSPHPRREQLFIELDRMQVKRLEDTRAGNDAHLQLSLSGLLWYPARLEFEMVHGGPLVIDIPKSHWAERVVSAWGLSTIKIVEIEFPKANAGEKFRTAHAKVEAAERLSANGQWKQTLAELYSAFEVLAKALNFSKPDQSFFAALLSTLHPAKKEKLKRALDSFCDLLHLGRHEPNESAELFTVSPRDARFALIMAHAIFEYITPEASTSVL